MSETLTHTSLEADQENTSGESYETPTESQDKKIGYSDLSASEQLRVQDSIDNNLGSICKEASTALQSLWIEASVAKADEDTQAYLYGLQESYRKKYYDSLNELAAGENVLLDEKGLEELRKKMESDLDTAKRIVEKRQSIHQAEAEEELRLKEHKERSSREQAERALKEQEAEQDKQILNSLKKQTEKEDSEATAEQPKLGFFEKRRVEQSKRDAMRVFSDVYQLDSQGYIERSDDLTDDQRKRLKEEVKRYVDMLDQVMSGETVPGKSTIERAEQLREKLLDIGVKVKKDYGEVLTKDEQKRLKKLKK